MKKTALSGVTLVELLIYMTILSLVTIGVTQMVTEIQKANVKAVNLADQFAESDLSMRRVQVKLGNSDDVEVVDLKKGTGDNACLRLKTYKQYTRKGIRFNGRNQMITGRNIDELPISGRNPRTLSTWVRIDPDHVGQSTVAMFGNGNGMEFGIDLLNGAPEVGFGCMKLRSLPQSYVSEGNTLTRPIDLRDGGWHHLVATFADHSNGVLTSQSARLYVDGVAVPTQVNACTTPPYSESVPYTTVNTWKTTLFIGRHIHDRQSSFKGLISDLRLWSRELSSSEILALTQRNPDAERNTSGLVVSMPLDNFTGTGLANKGTWTGGSAMHASKMARSGLIKSTLVDQTSYHSFCMIDDDGDGLHELWESETALNVPDRVGGDAYQARAATWDRISDDMFVPSQAGFFKVVGRDPESVIANFAVGKGIGDQENLRQKAQSKPLATTRSKTQLELCAIDTKPLTIPRVCENKFKEAYVAIDGYIKGLHGELDIQHATWTESEGVKRTINVPNMPGTVSATWYPQYGVMKYASTVPIADKYWQRAMATTLYRPSGRSSDSTVTFSFGVGDLPLFQNGEYRFFRFVENNGSGDAGANAGRGEGEGGTNEGGTNEGGTNEGGTGEGGTGEGGTGEGGTNEGGTNEGGTNEGGTGEGGAVNAVTFNSAIGFASGRSDACGMQSFLATITTEEEHDHLAKVMMLQEIPGWRSGYIGAKATTYDTFDWVTGPAADRGTFWFGLGKSGLPYKVGDRERIDPAGRTLFEYDPRPEFAGNRLRLLVQPTRNDSFLFTNWAGGKENTWGSKEYSCDSQDRNTPYDKCQPSSGTPGEGVAIYGHKNREGTWFSVPSEAQKCDPTREHSICGYYVEFQEPETEPDPLDFAHQITLDMGRFRDFCQAAGKPAG